MHKTIQKEKQIRNNSRKRISKSHLQRRSSGYPSRPGWRRWGLRTSCHPAHRRHPPGPPGQRRRRRNPRSPSERRRDRRRQMGRGNVICLCFFGFGVVFKFCWYCGRSCCFVVGFVFLFVALMLFLVVAFRFVLCICCYWKIFLVGSIFARLNITGRPWTQDDVKSSWVMFLFPPHTKRSHFFIPSDNQSCDDIFVLQGHVENNFESIARDGSWWGICIRRSSMSQNPMFFCRSRKKNLSLEIIESPIGSPHPARPKRFRRWVAFLCHLQCLACRGNWHQRTPGLGGGRWWELLVCCFAHGSGLDDLRRLRWFSKIEMILEE